MRSGPNGPRLAPLPGEGGVLSALRQAADLDCALVVLATPVRTRTRRCIEC